MDVVEFGRYRLLEPIGEGGMGRVYKARDTLIDRDVAIKVLSTELAAEEGYRERFRREAQTAARLTEPHIVPIFDTGEIDGRLYLVMPIIEGVDVASVLQRDGPMTPQLAVRVIEQLASALDAAHAQGLVHRDVKPSNALITGAAGREFIYLIDFGIAHDLRTAATKLTRKGSILGTFAYMAPERFTTGKADGRTDIYALTCVLHECLTGSRPFPGDSMEQQVTGHLTKEPPRPTALRPGIPTAFDEVVARGMAKDPDQRYQTALELATAAEHALSQPAPPPTPEPPPTELPHPEPETAPVTFPTAPVANTPLTQPAHPPPFVPPPVVPPPAVPPPALPPPAVPAAGRNRNLLVIAGSALGAVALLAILVYLVFWPSRDGPTGPPPTTSTSTQRHTTSSRVPTPTTTISSPYYGNR